MLFVEPSIPLTVASTNVAASSAAAWASGTSYTTGDIARHHAAGDAYEHEWQASQDHSGQEPSSASDYWIDNGPVNQWRMFDGYNNSATVADDPGGDIVVEVTLSSRLSHVYLLGLRDVAQITIEQIVEGTTVATHTSDLVMMFTPVGWWSHFFGERVYSGFFSLNLYGIYVEQTIRITLTGYPTAKCAQCLVGKGYEIGTTGDRAQPRLRSFSTFEAGTFGYRYVPRINTRGGTYTVYLDTHEIDRVFQLMERKMESLVVLDANNANNSFDAAIGYGKIVDFRPTISYGKSAFEIKLDGLN